MDLLNTASIFRYHKNLALKHGIASTGALGWKKPEGQQARFKILSGIANLDNSSVLDAGCGHGDLCEYLRKMYTGLQYYGVEQIPTILDVALSRYSHPGETWFLEGDFSTSELPSVDYILACGSLSYHNSDRLFIFNTIKKLFAASRLGFGFNLLSKTDFAEGLLAAYDPGFIKAFCLTITEKIILHEGYYEDDFTVFMYH